MANRKPQYLPIGAVSEGTMRGEDLVPAYIAALDPLQLHRPHRKLLERMKKEVSRIGTDEQVTPSEEAWDRLIEDAELLMASYTPPLSYFGSHEGDGACFGVWPITDNPDFPRYPAGESPRNSDYCYEVTDHGNISCGYRDSRGKWHEYWSVV